jgi:glycosyltransferase involved in cell wall biosynthesis
MLEALRADPCRFIEALVDARQLRRIWRAWRRRGTQSLLDEISVDQVESSLFIPATNTTPSSLNQNKPALLVIDSRIPLYDRDAGGRSSFLYLKILCELGHKVYFMPNDQLRREPYASSLESMGVELLIGDDFRCGKWKKWLKDRAGKITHVILHRPNVAKRYIAPILSMRGLRILYFAHDLRSIREARHYEVDCDAYHLHEAEYWEEIERRILSKVDKAYFFSDVERRIASAWGAGDVACTVPLYPIDVLPSGGLPYEQRSGLLFVGGFAHQPNVDGVLWFAKEVFPLVRQALPTMEWRIVGREPPSEILSLVGNGIIVEGGVSENRLEALYRSSRLVVAPLRFGAGIKGKVVEALLQRVPIVTTTIGAEGIPDSEAVLEIKDLPDDFARAVVKVCCEGNAWSAQSVKMKAYVMKYFSATVASKILEEEISQT